MIPPGSGTARASGVHPEMGGGSQQSRAALPHLVVAGEVSRRQQRDVDADKAMVMDLSLAFTQGRGTP